MQHILLRFKCYYTVYVSIYHKHQIHRDDNLEKAEKAIALNKLHTKDNIVALNTSKKNKFKYKL